MECRAHCIYLRILCIFTMDNSCILCESHADVVHISKDLNGSHCFLCIFIKTFWRYFCQFQPFRAILGLVWPLSGYFRCESGPCQTILATNVPNMSAILMISYSSGSRNSKNLKEPQEPHPPIGVVGDSRCSLIGSITFSSGPRVTFVLLCILLLEVTAYFSVNPNACLPNHWHTLESSSIPFT